jgi:hypothetical protein
MKITESRHEALLARVKRLGVETRIWQIAGLLLLLTAGFSRVVNVKAQENSPTAPMRATTVEAQNFLLKDAAGKVMGQLTVRDGKAQLDLYDGSGKVTWSTNTRAIAMGR